MDKPRREGHSALRVKDGKLEKFDPHPESAPTKGATPRTDAVSHDIFLSSRSSIPSGVHNRNALEKLLALARQLERDLASARADAVRWADEVVDGAALVAQCRLILDSRTDNICLQGYLNALEDMLNAAPQGQASSRSQSGDVPARETVAGLPAEAAAPAVVAAFIGPDTQQWQGSSVCVTSDGRWWIWTGIEWKQDLPGLFATSNTEKGA